MSSLILRARISLFDQDTVVGSMPDAGPALVGPGQAERKIGLRRSREPRRTDDRESLATEPVVPVAERLHAVPAGEVGLRLAVSGSRRS